MGRPSHPNLAAGGSNPRAIFFRPFQRSKVFRFWPAFSDYKHGKERSLEEIKEELLEYVQVNQGQDV